MKHEIIGVIEKDGVRYDYEAVIFSGFEANSKRDEVPVLISPDGEVDCSEGNDLRDELCEMALDDANERVRYCLGPDAIKDDETLDEYLGRMAKIWHPEELRPTSPMIECITKLRDYLLESHQEELDTNHHGDGPEGCTYCAAIKEATEILKSYGRE